LTAAEGADALKASLNIFLGPMPLFFNTQAKHIKSITHDSIAMIFPKNLPTPWRDSNPGLLF
jgi:hypothetical protein